MKAVYNIGGCLPASGYDYGPARRSGLQTKRGGGKSRRQSGGKLRSDRGTHSFGTGATERSGRAFDEPDLNKREIHIATCAKRRRSTRPTGFYAFIIFPVLLTAAIVFGLIYAIFVGSNANPQILEHTKYLLADGFPKVIQVIINLFLLYAICACGANLCLKSGSLSGKQLLCIAAVSAASAFLLHGMVYGVSLVIPAPYVLFGQGNEAISLLPVLDAAPFSGNAVICGVFGGIVHALAPQVLLGIAVCATAVKEYRHTGK